MFDSQRRSIGLTALVALLVSGGAVRLAVARPSAEAETENARAPARDVPVWRDGRIRFSSSYAKKINLSTAEVRATEVAPTIELTGELDFSPTHKAATTTRIAGQLTEVFIVEGQSVKRGQPLVRLHSVELGQAQAKLAAARAEEQLARQQFQRKKLLVAEGIIAKRALEQARFKHVAARASRRALADTVQSMTGEAAGSEKQGGFVLRSPIDGEVLQVMAVPGQSVAAGELLVSLANMQQLWLELAAYEQDLARVLVGDEVVVRPNGQEGEVFRGRVEHVGSVIDPATRTAKLRVRVDNTEGKLRVGQAVRARVVSRGNATHALAIPNRSVILIDGHASVFVLLDDGSVEPRRIELGVRGAEKTAVVSGLKASEKVVTDGVFSLKSELFR